MDEKNAQAAKIKLTTPSAAQQAIFWLLIAIGTISDLWSKSAVFAWLEAKPYQQHIFIENLLSFILQENQGAAFSMMYGKRIFLVSISTIALIAMIFIFYKGFSKGWFMTITMGLFVAGIIGNLWDRAFNAGAVRDFIDVYIAPFNYHWPTFNIADSLMCIALGLFLIHSFFAKDEKKQKH